MRHLHIKSKLSHMHMPHWRVPHCQGMCTKANHIVHDERFWAVLAMVALMAVLLIIAFASGTGQGNLDVDRIPTYPFRF